MANIGYKGFNTANIAWLRCVHPATKRWTGNLPVEGCGYQSNKKGTEYVSEFGRDMPRGNDPR